MLYRIALPVSTLFPTQALPKPLLSSSIPPALKLRL